MEKPISQTIVLPRMLRHPDDVYLRLLRERRGYYNAVIDPATGLPIGPLVAYSGKYDVEGVAKKQWVGYIYYNCAMLEQNPAVADFFAQGLASVIADAGFPEFDCIVGVPDGGLIISQNTARHLGVSYAGLQKKVVVAGTETTKEQTKLVLARHGIEPGMRVLLGEDLINNFSTTDKAIAVVEKRGAQVVGLVAIVNRSWPPRRDFKGLPVGVLLDRPTPQHKQEDVAAHIQAVGLLPDVKPAWSIVAKAMEDAEARGIQIV